jgi:hypothetical protein
MSEPTDTAAVTSVGAAPASDATASDDQPEKLESQSSQPAKSSLKESIVSHNLERDHVSNFGLQFFFTSHRAQLILVLNDLILII